jgi:short-chain fatty acids transporter
MGIEIPPDDTIDVPRPSQPGEWLEYSPILTVLLVLLSAGWLTYELATKNPMIAISSLKYLQFPVHNAGIAAALAAKAFLDCRYQGSPGDCRSVNSVSILWRHRRDPDSA